VFREAGQADKRAGGQYFYLILNGSRAILVLTLLLPACGPSAGAQTPQYGLWTAISTLLLKVPEQELTFVILGNTDTSPLPTGSAAATWPARPGRGSSSTGS